jgi:hypothetical protein
MVVRTFFYWYIMYLYAITLNHGADRFVVRVEVSVSGQPFGLEVLSWLCDKLLVGAEVNVEPVPMDGAEE